MHGRRAADTASSRRRAHAATAHPTQPCTRFRSSQGVPSTASRQLLPRRSSCKRSPSAQHRPRAHATVSRPAKPSSSGDMPVGRPRTRRTVRRLVARRSGAEKLSRRAVEGGKTSRGGPGTVQAAVGCVAAWHATALTAVSAATPTVHRLAYGCASRSSGACVAAASRSRSGVRTSRPMHRRTPLSRRPTRAAPGRRRGRERVQADDRCDGADGCSARADRLATAGRAAPRRASGCAPGRPVPAGAQTQRAAWWWRRGTTVACTCRGAPGCDGCSTTARGSIPLCTPDRACRRALSLKRSMPLRACLLPTSVPASRSFVRRTGWALRLTAKQSRRRAAPAVDDRPAGEREVGHAPHRAARARGSVLRADPVPELPDRECSDCLAGSDGE